MTEVEERSNAIEECYEFMLAYAAQGLPTHQDSQSGGRLREFLIRAATALPALAESFAIAVKMEGLEQSERYQGFLEVVDRDARDSLAAIEMVLAQPAISSQLIDNLNASIHLRALLTDLFLLTEIFKTQRNWAQRVVPAEGTAAIAADEPARSTV